MPQPPVLDDSLLATACISPLPKSHVLIPNNNHMAKSCIPGSWHGRGCIAKYVDNLQYWKGVLPVCSPSLIFPHLSQNVSIWINMSPFVFTVFLSGDKFIYLHLFPETNSFISCKTIIYMPSLFICLLLVCPFHSEYTLDCLTAWYILIPLRVLLL